MLLLEGIIRVFSMMFKGINGITLQRGWERQNEPMMLIKQTYHVETKYKAVDLNYYFHEKNVTRALLIFFIWETYESNQVLSYLFIISWMYQAKCFI